MKRFVALSLIVAGMSIGFGSYSKAAVQRFSIESPSPSSETTFSEEATSSGEKVKKKEKEDLYLDRVILINSDEITGELKTIEEGIIHLKSPFLPEEARIPMQNVRRIFFRKPSYQLSSGPDQVLFPEGDKLSGKVVSMDSAKIVLETGYAQSLNIKKDMVEAILLASESSLVFSDDFSKKSDRWTSFEGDWTVKDGKLVLGDDGVGEGGWVSARVDQEGKMTYEWEMETSEDFHEAGIMFFLNNLDFFSGAAQEEPKAYLLLVGGDGIGLARFDDFVSSDSFRQYSFGEGKAPKKIKFRLEYDSESGVSKVWANSESPVITYNDPAPLKSGSCIILGSDSPISFDNLRVSMGVGLPRDMKKGSEKTDMIHLKNSDRVTGEVKAIKKDKVSLATDHGKIKVDRGKVFAIVFNRDGITKPDKGPGSARLTLHNFDKFTVDIQSLDEKILSAESAFAGEVKIDRFSIKEVYFGDK